MPLDALAGRIDVESSHRDAATNQNQVVKWNW
jgi:hypothetical protein